MQRGGRALGCLRNRALPRAARHKTKENKHHENYPKNWDSVRCLLPGGGVRPGGAAGRNSAPKQRSGRSRRRYLVGLGHPQLQGQAISGLHRRPFVRQSRDHQGHGFG